MALFKLVGSKQILSLWVLDLSFDSTNTKLLIQGVASVTGFNTLVCSILSISCLNVSFRCMGTGLQCVCFGCTQGSRCMVYGGPGFANSFKDIWVMSHNKVLACNLLVGPLLLYFWYIQGILHIGWHTCFCLRVALCKQLLGPMYLYWCWHLFGLLGVILCAGYRFALEAGNPVQILVV